MRLTVLLLTACYIILAFGCSTAYERKLVGSTPIVSTQTISSQDFDLYRIDSIMLAFNGEIIATLHPQYTKQGTRQPERQYGTWELTYLNSGLIYETLSEDDAELVIDRVTPDPERDADLMLNPGPQVINIGGFDHTLIIWKPEETPQQHHWIYYSGAGKVCEGTVSFVIKSAP